MNVAQRIAELETELARLHQFKRDVILMLFAGKREEAIGVLSRDVPESTPGR